MAKQTREAPEHFTSSPEDKDRVLKALGIYTERVAKGDHPDRKIDLTKADEDDAAMPGADTAEAESDRLIASLFEIED